MMKRDTYHPDRGDIVWINLNPRVGHEQSGHRPALVLSIPTMVRTTNMAIICPITSKVRGHPYEVPLLGTKTQGVVLVPQVRSIDFGKRKIRHVEKAPIRIVDNVAKKVSLIIGAS